MNTEKVAKTFMDFNHKHSFHLIQQEISWIFVHKSHNASGKKKQLFTLILSWMLPYFCMLVIHFDMNIVY